MTATLRRHPLRLMALFVLIAAVALSTVSPGIQAAETDNPQVTRAIAWLTDQQTPDGGFAAFGGESDPGATADVVYALVAAGAEPPAETITYLIDAAGESTGDPGVAGKVALALLAVGRDPHDAGGVDLIAAIEDGQDPGTGFYGLGVFNHAYALLAMTASGADIDPVAVEALLAAQIEDGSWSFTGDATPGTGDSNTTAIVIQALVAVNGDTRAVDAGIDYILSLQDDDGAIAYDDSEAPEIVGDANSTAVAIQALVAAGADASALVAALGAFQNPSGAFFWRSDFADDSLLATAQAVPALLERPLPLDATSARPAEPGPENALEFATRTASPAPGCDYFEITGHNLCGSFAEFWVVNGGLMMFGYPLTEEFVDEDGRTVQLFERARFELHPELAGTPYHVLLGRLGAEHLERDASQP